SDLLGEVEARFEAGFEELRIGLSRVPVRTDRVDDPCGLEVAGGRGHGLARRQAPHMSRLPDLATGFEQCGTGRAVDGPVDPAAAEQRRLRGIDDVVDGNLGDIAFENRDLHASSLNRVADIAHRRSLEATRRRHTDMRRLLGFISPTPTTAADL